MGRRGPKPKPTHLRILEGNPGRRTSATTDAAKFDRMPQPPTRYRQPSKHLWKKLSRQLTDANILTKLDVFALEMLVDAYMDYQTAVMAADDPKQIDAAQKQLYKMLREFGLTPASRSAVTPTAATEKKKADPAAKYFG